MGRSEKNWEAREKKEKMKIWVGNVTQMDPKSSAQAHAVLSVFSRFLDLGTCVSTSRFLYLVQSQRDLCVHHDSFPLHSVSPYLVPPYSHSHGVPCHSRRCLPATSHLSPPIKNLPLLLGLTRGLHVCVIHVQPFRAPCGCQGMSEPEMICWHTTTSYVHLFLFFLCPSFTKPLTHP